MKKYATIESKDLGELNEFLDQWLNQNGEEPHLAGVDAGGAPFVAWLDEVGGDETYMQVRRLEVQDGGTTEELRSDRSALVFPVVFMTEM